MTTAAKKWTKSEIRQKMTDSNEWLVRGLMAIYARQTQDEKISEDTKHHNKMGFNGTDAKILTSFAKQWEKKNWLSDKQMNLLRKKMMKYAGQLCRIANGTVNEKQRDQDNDGDLD